MRPSPTRCVVLSLPLLSAVASAAVTARLDEPRLSERSDPDPIYFEERIQPVYAANCGTSGCHGSAGSGRLVLERPDFQGRYTLEQTEKNLETTLQFVEFGNPMASRLLLKPLKEKDGGLPHTGKQYDFQKGSEEYAIFADWIRGAEITQAPPIADAGPDKAGKRGQEIVLDGTASRERRDGTLEYQWTLESKPAGSTPVLKRSDTAHPTLRADADGAYTLSLVVRSEMGESAPETTMVTIDSSPFIVLEAEEAVIESGFHTPRDGAASELRALAPAQDASLEKPGAATLRFTVPRSGAYRWFARAALGEGDAMTTLSLDGGATIPLEIDGPGYRLIEIPLALGDGSLAGGGGRAVEGGVAIRDGHLVLRGEEGAPARFEIDGAAPTSLSIESTWSVPDAGALHAQGLYVRFGARGSTDGVLAGIEFGRNRYVVKSVTGGSETVLAEKRHPFRPGSASKFGVDRGGESLFLQLPDGEVLTAKVGSATPDCAEWVAVGEHAVDQTAYARGEEVLTFDYAIDADPAGFLRAGDHEIRLRASGESGPRVDQIFLTPREGATTTTTGRSREIRALYLDLLGRTPTAIERLMAAAVPRERLVRQLVESLEFEENLYQLELYYYLLLDNFHPRTPQLEALPSRLKNDETDWRDATREIVISQYFNARNPGNDTFVTVILEQLLGITVQDEPRLLEAGKKMYDGYKATVFGVVGASQSDLVGIVLAQPRFATRFIQRHYERLIGEPPPGPDLVVWADRFRVDPRVYRDLVREWMDSDAYRTAISRPRAKSDFMWIRGVFVDLLGRKPSFEEFRNFRNAVQALADSRPLRSVLGKVILDSGQVVLPERNGLDARGFVHESFDRLLGRAPREVELAAFTAALTESTLSPSSLVQAILSSAEYQMY